MASYTLWQAVGTLYQLAFRALAMASLREPGPPGAPGEKGQDGAPGSDGSDGRGWNERGQYELGEAYRRDDVVWRDMSPFLARCDEPGPCEEGNPNWRLIVARASRGSRARPAIAGRAGLPGAAAPRPSGSTRCPIHGATRASTMARLASRSRCGPGLSNTTRRRGDERSRS
jgi:hypothetical protein